MLNLNVPGTDPVLKNKVETRPKAVAEWLDQLPFASPSDTAQQLLMALYALNRQPLDADDRATLLALYRPVVARAAASLEAMLADSGVPPQAQQRQTGTLLRELHLEHGIGYKHLLLGLTNRRFGRPNPKHLAEASAWLLAALRDFKTACYLSYSQLPAGLWQEIHHVFQFAQSTGLANEVVENAPPASLTYRQALLTELASPPHMSPAELEITQAYLGKFAGLAPLMPAMADPPRPGFLIPVQSDRAAGQPTDVPQAGDLWLGTEALCRHVHETVLRLRAGDTPRQLGLPKEMESEPSSPLLKRLMKRWGNVAQRAFKRYAASGSTLQLLAGISAIHRHLDPALPPGLSGNDIDDNLPFCDLKPFAAPAATQITQWTISNDSAAGMALLGAPGLSLSLKVGDPLALRANDNEAWSLAVIRWVRMRDAQQVELGIERISPQMQAVWVQPLRGRRQARPEPALFVPGLAALKQPDRLLLPRLLHQIGMDAEIWHGERHYALSFGRCAEHTSSFDLIEFTVLAD